MKFLNDIRKQSKEVRETMFYLSVIITVLLIGTVWFRSFQKDLYVLMNPEDDFTRTLAVESGPVPSLFGFIWQGAGNLQGLFSSVFTENSSSEVEYKNEKAKVENEKVYILPLSEKR